jgi:endoglycosylceramidase
MRRLAVVALTVGLALALTASAAAKPEPPLDHNGRWFVDSSGRVVILHGLNMVYKVGSYRPADSGFGTDDARWLRRNGFNTIRLGIIYKGLEPAPPAAPGTPTYDEGYLRSIARTEAILAKQRIFTLLDFHQDLYNERFQGEGWPDWQVLDDGEPPEPQVGFPGNYIVNQGLNRAFDNFWANATVAGRGLQDAYAEAWQRVAADFEDRPYVMGYDLLNEPWPGSAFTSDACLNTSGCQTFDATTLGPFFAKLYAAIRAVDTETLIFNEPLVTFDFGADTQLPDTGDPASGFSYHVYCLPGSLGGPGSGPTCEPLEDMALTNADKHSEATGDVPFLTEFGATDDLEAIERIVRLADDHMVSWQEWHYCDCADPTTSGPGVQSLVVDPSKPPQGDNVKRDKLAVLARPYPRAVAGTPQNYGFDPATKRFHLTYATKTPSGKALPRTELTEVFLPRIQYPHGHYEVHAKGASVVSKRRSKVLRLERDRGAKAVSVTVAPSTRSQ